MNMIGLVAMREYAENVKTKGFWITILIIPVILVGMFFLQVALQRATPQRYFILIDQTGQYQEAVAAAVARDHQRRILQEFVSFLIENRRDRELNLEAANASSAIDQLIDDVEADEVSALDEWIDSGGLQYAQVMASPYLREGTEAFEPPPPQFVAAELPPGVDASASPEQIVEELRPYLLGDRDVSANGEAGELFALILIPADVNNDISRPGTPPTQNLSAGIQYWARNLTDSRLPDAISRSINEEIRSNEFTAAGVDAQLVRNVQRTRLPVAQLDPSAEQGEETVSAADTFRQFAPMGFVYLMFISLMQNVQYLLSNTIEEKSNRIIEVLLASVTPNELMMGKLVGIGLAGLTTIAAWLLSAYLFIINYESTQTELMAEILDVIFGSDLIPWFVFYYFAGYALYSGMFIAIGSLCNTLKEAQALMTPMIFIQVIPIAMMAFVVMDPN
ncbi:MAG: ABC transporter permease, partial [Gammaproteobacteria bacterium]